MRGVLVVLIVRSEHHGIGIEIKGVLRIHGVLRDVLRGQDALARLHLLKDRYDRPHMARVAHHLLGFEHDHGAGVCRVEKVDVLELGRHLRKTCGLSGVEAERMSRSKAVSTIYRLTSRLTIQFSFLPATSTNACCSDYQGRPR